MSDLIPVLTCSLAHQQYAFLIDDVVEVSAMVEMTQVNQTQPEFLGMVNRHGSPLPLLDLHVMMGQGRALIDISSIFIVVHHEDALFGLVVGNVHQVEYFQEEQIHKPAGFANRIHGIISDKGKLIQIIDVRALLAPYISLKVDR